MGKKLLIFGTGLLAEVLNFYLEKDLGLHVDAFTVDDEYCNEENFLGVPLIPMSAITNVCPTKDYYFLVAVGYAGLNTIREKRALELSKFGYTPIKYVSSKANIASNVIIQDGCIIFEGTSIQPFVKIKGNVLIWNNAFIGHHTVIGNSCFIGAGAMINGGISIGDRCLIGSGAIVREFVSIGENSIVGAGSTLLRHLNSGSVCNNGESPVIRDCAEKIKLWPPHVERK